MPISDVSWFDTNVLAELEKPKPNPGLRSWFESVDWLDLHLSVITVAELWSGIAALPSGRKRRSLEVMFELLPDRFAGRILSVDFQTAIRYGEVQTRSGPLPPFDALLGATALVHRLTVITRNTADLGRTGAKCLDPWA